WGQREQDVLKGVVGTLAVTTLLRQAQQQKRQAAQQPTYYYVDPQPQYQQPQRHYSHSSVYSTPAAQAFNSYSRGERQAIQRQLARHGYYYGGIDGAFGPGTYRAVEDYARDSGNRGSLSSRNGAFALYDSLIF
ncbi:MAG: peptidoglycan-binding domain-containing protein, partial [Paracoccaceae bacterium]